MLNFKLTGQWETCDESVMNIRLMHIPLDRILTKLAHTLLRWGGGEDTMSTERGHRDPAAYTLVDLTIDEPCNCRGVYVGTGGNITIQSEPDADPVTIAVTDGQLLPVETHMVVDTQLGPELLRSSSFYGAEASGGPYHQIRLDKSEIPWNFITNMAPNGSAFGISFDNYIFESGKTYEFKLTDLRPNSIAGSSITIETVSGLPTPIVLSAGTESVTSVQTMTADSDRFNLVLSGKPDGIYQAEVREVIATGLTTATGLAGLK